MTIAESTTLASDFLDNLVSSDAPDGLILYPDRVDNDGDDLVAAFRPDAQALRILAAERGIPVTVVTPDDAKVGIYTEHAADWVLPVVSIPTSVVATLIADYLRYRLHGWRAGSSERRSPVVRYREVERSADGSSRVRQIEGPAEDVMAWLDEKVE